MADKQPDPPYPHIKHSSSLGILKTLPLETRQQIYSLILDDPVIAFPSDRTIDSPDRLWKPPALLHTCKELTAEGMDVLYTLKTFHVKLANFSHTRWEHITSHEESYYRSSLVIQTLFPAFDLRQVKNFKFVISFERNHKSQCTGPGATMLIGSGVRSMSISVHYPATPLSELQNHTQRLMRTDRFVTSVLDCLMDAIYLHNSATIVLEWPNERAQQGIAPDEAFLSSSLMNLFANMVSFQTVAFECENWSIHDSPSPGHELSASEVEGRCAETLGPAVRQVLPKKKVDDMEEGSKEWEEEMGTGLEAWRKYSAWCQRRERLVEGCRVLFSPMSFRGYGGEEESGEGGKGEGEKGGEGGDDELKEAEKGAE